MADEKLFPWMPEFYCDDVYWLVTVDGLVRGLFALESDARQFFGSIDPAAVDGDVHLWRLNGGHLCRPHVEARTSGVALDRKASDEESNSKQEQR